MAGSDRAWRTSSFPSGSDIVMVGVCDRCFFRIYGGNVENNVEKNVGRNGIYLFIYFELVV